MSSNFNISQATDGLFTTNKFVRELCLLGESLGISRVEFAKSLGLSLSSIEDPKVIISKQYITKAYTILLEFADDEFLGAATAKLPRGSVDLMIKSACTEQTLEHALEAIKQVIRITQSPIGSKVTIENNMVHWQFSPQVKEQRFFPLMTTLCTCIAHAVLSMLLKNDVALEYVSLTNKRPDNISDYQFLYGCPLKFNQQHNKIVFDKKLLNSPIRCNYHEVKHYLKVPLEITGYSHSARGEISQIKDIFAASPYAQFPDQHELAGQLGMSVRTMQRKLESESTSYMQLKDEVRQRKAIFYLEHTDKHLDEIAERCGFSEIASFTRAFIRWTGCSPSKYKR